LEKDTGIKILNQRLWIIDCSRDEARNRNKINFASIKYVSDLENYQEQPNLYYYFNIGVNIIFLENVAEVKIIENDKDSRKTDDLKIDEPFSKDIEKNNENEKDFEEGMQVFKNDLLLVFFIKNQNFVGGYSYPHNIFMKHFLSNKRLRRINNWIYEV
jgi:hypothetical protein